MSALICASQEGHCEIAKLLLENCAETNLQDDGGQSALMCASLEGHCDTAKLLLDKGAVADLQDKEGRSALMLASARGQCKVAEILIKQRVQVNLQDSKGFSALMHATVVYYERSKMIHLPRCVLVRSGSFMLLDYSAKQVLRLTCQIMKVSLP